MAVADVAVCGVSVVAVANTVPVVEQVLGPLVAVKHSKKVTLPVGAGASVAPVTFAESLTVPELPRTNVPWRVVAWVVVVVVAGVMWTHSVALGVPDVLSVDVE